MVQLATETIAAAGGRLRDVKAKFHCFDRERKGGHQDNDLSVFHFTAFRVEVFSCSVRVAIAFEVMRVARSLGHLSAGRLRVSRQPPCDWRKKQGSIEERGRR